VSRADDARRTARLLFAPELAEGRVRERDLDRADVRRAVAPSRVPPAPVRALQRMRMRRQAAPEEDGVGRAIAVRQAVLGATAPGSPRLLVRVDEFPHYRAWDEPRRYGIERFRHFHAILAEAGVPYLLAVPPRVSRRPLDPHERASRLLDDGERAALADVRADRVELALHGRDHRTRHRSPRRHSELYGLAPGALDARLALAESELVEATRVRPRVFVPPYNRFDAAQWPVLARRFDVVGGGPESVARFGLHPGPSWRGDAVWLPSYPPLYGRAAEVLPAVRRLATIGAATWIPVVLHWGWEADAGWEDLRRLAREAARWAAPWDGFLAAVDASR
jgi:peptidoglycan/xylan/chitin deacetylase (PgdA/CDA1 family)